MASEEKEVRAIVREQIEALPWKEVVTVSYRTTSAAIVRLS